MTALRDALRVLPHAVAYEWRKATAFRLGFLLREMLRGLGRTVVMIVVFYAMFASTGAEQFRGYTFNDLIGYMIWAALLQKVPVGEHTLDVADQIYDGYFTKYMVMPVSFFTLMLARFACFTAVQVTSSLGFWVLGALLLPGSWPHPASAAALLQAATLLLLGAYCYFLVHLILNYLAFWLDVVWSLIAMFRFVSMFIAGVMLPVALMPDAVHDALRWLFPYWTVFAPVELLMGRMDTANFVTGLQLLAASTVALQLLTALTFRRGCARFAGAGA